MTIQCKMWDPYLLSIIQAYLGYFYLNTGDYERGLQMAEERAANLMRYQTKIYQNFAQLFLAHARFFAGQFKTARSIYQEQLENFSRPNQSATRQFFYFMLQAIDLHTGDYEAVLEDASFGEEKPSELNQESLRVFKGMTYLLFDQWEKAEQELGRYLEHCLSLPRLDMVGQSLALLGYIANRRGNQAAALDLLEQALVNGLERGFFAVFMMALSVLALMLAEAGRLEQALELYATVTAHPFAGNSRWAEDLFGSQISALTADIPAEAAKAAQERGRNQRLAEAGEMYLQRLRNKAIFAE